MQLIKHFLNSLRKPKPIDHNQLCITKTYEYDSWNKVKHGQVKYKVYYNHPAVHKQSYVGQVDFRNSTGQVGFIEVSEQYRRRGIANYILSNVEKELQSKNINKIWAVCTKEHYFWSVQKDYVYYTKPHCSVTGSGYYKELHKKD